MLIFSKPELFDHSVASVDLADGDHAIADILGASGVGVESDSQLIQLGRSDRRYNRIFAEPYSALIAEDATGAYALHAGVAIMDGNRVVGLTTTKLGTGTATIGAGTGISGGSPDDTHRFADGLTWTETAYFTDMRQAMQAPEAAVHSPGDNTIASLMVGDVGFADVLLLEGITGLKWRVRVGV